MSISSEWKINPVDEVVSYGWFKKAPAFGFWWSLWSRRWCSFYLEPSGSICFPSHTACTVFHVSLLLHTSFKWMGLHQPSAELRELKSWPAYLNQVCWRGRMESLQGSVPGGPGLGNRFTLWDEKWFIWSEDDWSCGGSQRTFSLPLCWMSFILDEQREPVGCQSFITATFGGFGLYSSPSNAYFYI